MVSISLFVCSRRVLRGVVLRAVLAVLRIVLLRIVSLLLFLPISSEWGPEVARLRWRRILSSVTLLLVGWSVDDGQVGPRHPPSSGKSKEDREYDKEADDCDCDTCAGAQSTSAIGTTKTNGKG